MGEARTEPDPEQPPSVGGDIVRVSSRTFPDMQAPLVYFDEPGVHESGGE
jgi:hypothetical protein